MTEPLGGWTQTAIDGVLRRNVTFHADERGSFGELWRHSWTAAMGLAFTQANLSTSARGVLRGLHFHDRQCDMWVLIEGRASVALVDLRPLLAADRPERPVSLMIEMTAGGSVVIPPGVAHGFLALEDTRLLYLVTNEYDGTDERGFAWNDVLAAVNWPVIGSPILSARDSSAPSLENALGR